MLSIPYRKSHIPQPIADRDKQIAYLKEELKEANMIIEGQKMKIESLKRGQDALLKDNDYWHRMYMDAISIAGEQLK